MVRRTDRLWVMFGVQVRDARRAKRWSVRELAARAGISAGMLYRVEAGEPASTDTALKLAGALGKRVELRLQDTQLILLDPLAAGRQRQFIGLLAAGTARPRYRGYADALAALAADDRAA